MINYPELIGKYMRLVSYHEGVTFLDHALVGDQSNADFTAEEHAELKRIEDVAYPQHDEEPK